MMSGNEMGGKTEFNCDVCGSSNATEINCLQFYSRGQPIHVCKGCGFVYVRTRRSALAIADEWSDEIFGEHIYTARIPAVKARQVFVAEMIATTIGTNNKSFCDIGSGEGLFLDIVRQAEYGADVFAVEPSPTLCRTLTDRSIGNFSGTIEQFTESRQNKGRQFDIVTIMWTLENCQDARRMLQAAHDILTPDGHIVVATGSRILVPFKKPLNYYIADSKSDTHCFRFSANTLRKILAEVGFFVKHVNRYMDHDVLCMIGRKSSSGDDMICDVEDYRKVIDFFERWHNETQAHYPVE